MKYILKLWAILTALILPITYLLAFLAGESGSGMMVIGVPLFFLMVFILLIMIVLDSRKNKTPKL